MERVKEYGEVHRRAEVHEFSYNATIAKKKNDPSTGEAKSNVALETQHMGTGQRKNADKAAEALHYRV